MELGLSYKGHQSTQHFLWLILQVNFAKPQCLEIRSHAVLGIFVKPFLLLSLFVACLVFVRQGIM